MSDAAAAAAAAAAVRKPGVEDATARQGTMTIKRLPTNFEVLTVTLRVARSEGSRLFQGDLDSPVSSLLRVAQFDDGKSKISS